MKAMEQPSVGFKVFIGGISVNCEDKELKDYLSRFGVLLHCDVIRDKSGHSRGYAFASFKNEQSKKDSLGKNHLLKGKQFEVRDLVDSNKNNELLGAIAKRKLFISNIKESIRESDIQEFFQNFGNLEEVLVSRDPITQLSKGFGFVVFKEPESVGRLLKNNQKKLIKIKGHEIIIKEAIPKKDIVKMKQESKSKPQTTGHQNQEEEYYNDQDASVFPQKRVSNTPPGLHPHQKVEHSSFQKQEYYEQYQENYPQYESCIYPAEGSEYGQPHYQETFSKGSNQPLPNPSRDVKDSRVRRVNFSNTQKPRAGPLTKFSASPASFYDQEGESAYKARASKQSTAAETSWTYSIESSPLKSPNMMEPGFTFQYQAGQTLACKIPGRKESENLLTGSKLESISAKQALTSRGRRQNSDGGDLLKLKSIEIKEELMDDQTKLIGGLLNHRICLCLPQTKKSGLFGQFFCHNCSCPFDRSNFLGVNSENEYTDDSSSEEPREYGQTNKTSANVCSMSSCQSNPKGCAQHKYSPFKDSQFELKPFTKKNNVDSNMSTPKNSFYNQCPQASSFNHQPQLRAFPWF